MGRNQLQMFKLTQIKKIKNAKYLEQSQVTIICIFPLDKTFSVNTVTQNMTFLLTFRYAPIILLVNSFLCRRLDNCPIPSILAVRGLGTKFSFL